MNGARVAVVEMNAIPTTESEDPKAAQAAASLAQMFDNYDKYTGQLRLDLTTGTVDKYEEKLRSQWFMLDPAAKKTDENADSMTMTAVSTHILERID